MIYNYQDNHFSSDNGFLQIDVITDCHFQDFNIIHILMGSQSSNTGVSACNPKPFYNSPWNGWVDIHMLILCSYFGISIVNVSN